MADYKHLIIPRNWNQYINREDWRDLLTKFVEEEANVTVDVGSTTRTDYNSPPQVSNSGTNRNAILDFIIPSGDGIASMEETDIPATVNPDTSTADPHDNGSKAITLNWDSGKTDQFTIQHGKDGVGIKSIEQTTTNTADGATNEWTVTLTDERQAVISVKNGETGASIQTTTPYYLATSKSTDVTKDEEGWTTTPQQTTDTKKYLWSYVHTEYTDGTQIDSNPVVIGTKGEKGDKGDEITPKFTYEVDSDQALLDWANNASGNDYSAVLIRRGTWTSTTKGVNLTISGTKVVVGEPGSKLVFNQVEKALFYDTVPTGNEYWMRDVSIEYNNTYTIDPYKNYSAICIQNAVNLNNVQVYMKAYLDESIPPHFGDELYACGFNKCNKLTNCISEVMGMGGQSYGVDDNVIAGFGHCEYLNGCKGQGIADATYRSTDSSIYFIQSGAGFSHCKKLYNCMACGKEFGMDNMGQSTGASMYFCYSVIGCTQYNINIPENEGTHLNEWYTCYASSTANSTYYCDDTPEGGFNATVN